MRGTRFVSPLTTAELQTEIRMKRKIRQLSPQMTIDSPASQFSLTRFERALLSRTVLINAGAVSRDREKDCAEGEIWEDADDDEILRRPSFSSSQGRLHVFNVG